MLFSQINFIKANGTVNIDHINLE